MNIAFLIQLIIVDFSFSTVNRFGDILTNYEPSVLCKYVDGERASHSAGQVRVPRNGRHRADEEEDIFTDYCRKGLCELLSGDGAHSGCKNGTRHNGKFQNPPCSENATLIELTDKDKQIILDFHNIQRNFVACGGLHKDLGLRPGCRHGVVTWDKELEKTAFLHTSYCTFEHDKCRSTLKYPFSGQNLGIVAFGTQHGSAASYINLFSYLWYLEYYYAKTDLINAYYHPKEYMVGHFLVSLNERNNRVGCALASFFSAEKKQNKVMLSCNYPTTNIARSATYNSCKNPARGCTSGTDAKYKFLCSSKEKFDVSADLKLIPYDGDGQELFDSCGRQPELFHYEAEGADLVKRMHKSMYPNFPIATERPEGLAATTKKPEKTTTQKPANLPSEGNPNAGGEPDYSESEYDPIDSSSRLNIDTQLKYLYVYFVLFNCPLSSMFF